MATRVAPSRHTALWICPSCRRGTLGESACAYCSTPRSIDARPLQRAADPEPAPAVAPPAPPPPPPPTPSRRRPRVLIVVLLLVALVGGGLFVSKRLGASKPVAVASAPAPYVPPVRHLPSPDASVALPAALTAAPTAGDVITPAAASDIVHTTWDLRHQALSPVDLPLLAAFESGAALDVDVTRGPVSGDPYGPANQVVVSVPHQTSYPARFFAQVTTTASGQSWSAFLGFTRAGAQSPWTLQLMGGYAAGLTAVIAPAVDAGGFLMTQTARPTVDPATVHGLLTQYWSYSKDNGKVPSALLWEPGAWTTEFATRLSQHRQGAVAENGLVASYAYQAAPGASAYVFPTAEGSELVCSAIYMQTTFTSTGAKRVSQDAAQRTWGKSVPPGTYRAITQNTISVPCIELPRPGSHQKVSVLGAQALPDVTTYK